MMRVIWSFCASVTRGTASSPALPAAADDGPVLPTGNAARPAQHHGHLDKVCCICRDGLQPQTELCLRLLNCGCTYHFDCLAGYLKHQLSAGKVPFVCPSLVPSAVGGEHQCRTQLNAADLVMVMEDVELAKYDEMLIGKMAEMRVCGYPDCGYRFILGPERGVQAGFPCPKCKKLCLLCGGKVHKDMTCEQAKQDTARQGWFGLLLQPDQDDKRGEEAFLRYQKRHRTNVCPGCGAVISKTTGCNHMTCTHCGKEFRYNEAGSTKK
ncbi:unnamed protein product [Vitrella brassicaformis CCMP3155]|uniref:RBR-type E3 ubiquitin transferase n=2 Tax=Vitrella brassicaformis TaxID=1169539 RepID=A0A0G4G0U9_VITBC|nr:unnamed protein product [Vitrella brassicaformis CCMP3155]|mmetsp:Transcript_27398/g.68385  ORF Transcript_27398/g.68385 Transcript_27398/m.68385 type:complete len:267 (+) Transcript_27398:100-900(+)|eukprot:CEM21698.1 unnamed protein product [Vitrella brassicaformis CCMP3155]